MNETRVFFRDDDVRSVSPLRAVMHLLLDEAIPCSYQVIPQQLDAETARYLLDTKAANPGSVFFNQHGLRHEQVIQGQRRWSEFAGSRPYEEQLSDIERGREMLCEQLGDAFDAEVFTPPCHKYDDATLKALEQLGFTTLSAGVRTDPRARLFYAIGRRLGRGTWLGERVSYHGSRMPTANLTEVSVCIDVDEDVDRHGRLIEKTATHLWREFERARGSLETVGIMLHHEQYTSEARRSTLREFIRRLKADANVRIVSLPDLAQDLGRSTELALRPPAERASPPILEPREDSTSEPR